MRVLQLLLSVLPAATVDASLYSVAVPVLSATSALSVSVGTVLPEPLLVLNGCNHWLDCRRVVDRNRGVCMRIQKDSIDKWFDYGVLSDTRTIMLADLDADGVGDAMANQFIKAMHLLEQKPDPIKIILRSSGGYVFAGMAIYDAIRASKCYVTAEVYGNAMSMGAIILQAADERIMQPNAFLMIHDGMEYLEYPPRTIEAWAEWGKRSRQRMYEIFAERSGKTALYWDSKCVADYILSAPEALAEGLIDKVAE